MDRNSNGYKSVNTNGNLVRTKVKLYDSKDKVIAIFATGNSWSDGKLDVDKHIIKLLRSPKAILKGEINDKGKFTLSVSLNGEMYGFFNSPTRDASLDESDMALIDKARKAKKSRFEEIVNQATRKLELEAL